MASEQARREKVRDEHERKIQKDRVPKITSHFESLAEQQQQQQGPSLEEISNLRATAQQNSTEAIRAAEERYLHKAKESSQTAGSHQHALGKNATVDASSKTTAAGFIGEKAAAAMNVTLESGKGAAGYAGKVASGVKDQAVVAGWGATHYTLEKVAEATKGAADMTSSVAGYSKDKVAGAGQTVGGYAGEKMAAAKDAALDYAARKKAEAHKDLEGKNKLSHEQRRISSVKEDYFGDEGEQKQQQGEGGADDQLLEGEQKASSGTGTVLQAIGETIVEIGQTTKDLLVGPGHHPVDQLVEKEHKGE